LIRPLDKLTVLIPSLGREDFLLRALTYWSSFDVSIVVMSGLPVSSSIANLRKAIRGLQLVEDESGILERLYVGSLLSTTPYTVVISDDEYMLPSALEYAISHLETHLDFVGASGLSLGFGKIRGRYAVWRAYNSKNFQLTQSSVEQRLQAAFRSYAQPLFWSVFRTKSLQSALRDLRTTKGMPAAVSELTFCADICIQGKYSVLPRLLWLRSAENPNQWKPYAEGETLNQWLLEHPEDINAIQHTLGSKTTCNIEPVLAQVFFEQAQQEMKTTRSRIRDRIMHRSVRFVRPSIRAKLAWLSWLMPPFLGNSRLPITESRANLSQLCSQISTLLGIPNTAELASELAIVFRSIDRHTPERNQNRNLH